MARSRTRFATLVLVLAAAAGAAVYARAPDAAPAAADALRAAAPAERFSAEPASAEPPPRPRREIVDGVEVVVNIPAGRLSLVQGDSVVQSYPVSVGSAGYPTPAGDYLLATVIWNPWWHPPPESGWARGRKPEPPGSPGNPMGRVKLHMDELIYIHGTTAEGRLGAPASHGCIRMSNRDVVDLARRLHRIADPEAREAALDSLAEPGRVERRTIMARTIRMRVDYEVAEVRGGRLHVYPDVYAAAGADYLPRVLRSLGAAGVDTAALPAPSLGRLRQAAARGRASFALAEIAALTPLPPEAPRERGPRLLGRPVGEPAQPTLEPEPAPEPEPEPVAAPAEATVVEAP